MNGRVKTDRLPGEVLTVEDCLNYRYCSLSHIAIPIIIIVILLIGSSSNDIITIIITITIGLSQYYSNAITNSKHNSLSCFVTMVVLINNVVRYESLLKLNKIAKKCRLKSPYKIYLPSFSRK